MRKLAERKESREEVVKKGRSLRSLELYEHVEEVREMHGSPERVSFEGGLAVSLRLKSRMHRAVGRSR